MFLVDIMTLLWALSVGLLLASLFASRGRRRQTMIAFGNVALALSLGFTAFVFVRLGVYIIGFGAGACALVQTYQLFRAYQSEKTKLVDAAEPADQGKHGN